MIARELHDEIGQEITGLKLHLEAGDANGIETALRIAGELIQLGLYRIALLGELLQSFFVGRVLLLQLRLCGLAKLIELLLQIVSFHLQGRVLVAKRVALGFKLRPLALYMRQLVMSGVQLLVEIDGGIGNRPGRHRLGLRLRTGAAEIFGGR